jgi:TolB-like protein
MSEEPEQEYFSDSKLRWFYVIARNSSFAYKGQSFHLKQIGEELVSAMSSKAAFARTAIVYGSRSS